MCGRRKVEVKLWPLFSESCMVRWVSDRLQWVPVCLLFIFQFVFSNDGPSNTGQGQHQKTVDSGRQEFAVSCSMTSRLHLQCSARMRFVCWVCLQTPALPPVLVRQAAWWVILSFITHPLPDFHFPRTPNICTRYTSYHKFLFTIRHSCSDPLIQP